jgi:hypothetical protein
MPGRDPAAPETAQRTVHALDLRQASPWVVSIHMLPPPLRAELRASLSPEERRLLSLVACACSSLPEAARALDVPHEEAVRLWRTTAARIVALAREAERS